MRTAGEHNRLNQQFVIALPLYLEVMWQTAGLEQIPF